MLKQNKFKTWSKILRVIGPQENIYIVELTWVSPYCSDTKKIIRLITYHCVYKTLEYPRLVNLKTIPFYKNGNSRNISNENSI